jgi:hypothetical protein
MRPLALVMTLTTFFDQYINATQRFCAAKLLVFHSNNDHYRTLIARRRKTGFFVARLDNPE